MAGRPSSMATVVRSPPAFPHQANRVIEFLTSRRPSWTPRITGFSLQLGRRRSTSRQIVCYRGRVSVVRLRLHRAHQWVWVITWVPMPPLATVAGDSIAGERPTAASSVFRPEEEEGRRLLSVSRCLSLVDGKRARLNSGSHMSV
jgi:hypothetical protein